MKMPTLNGTALAILAVVLLGAWVVLATINGAMHVPENDPPPEPAPQPEPEPEPEPAKPATAARIRANTRMAERRAEQIDLPEGFVSRRTAERRAH